MRSIYFSGQNKSMALYPFRNQVYRVLLEGGQAVRPVLLCNDYLGELSDAAYRGTVYFCYRNRHQEILLQNAADRTPEYRLDRNAFYEEADYIAPQLLNWHEHLLLMCFVKQPEHTGMTLEGIFPFEDRKLRLPDMFSERAAFSIQSFGEMLFCSVREAGMCRCYVSEENGDFQELLKAQEMKEKNTFAEKQEQQQVILLQEEKQQMEAKLREKEMIIESVKVQYDDLMNTAIQYREEAKRWREKYLTKK